MASNAALEHFVSTFVAPIVLGGRVEVDGLIAPGVLREWLANPAMDGAVVAKINRVVHDRLAKLGPVGMADQLPPDALALAAAWHDLLAMTHPDARERRGLRRKARTWCLGFLSWAGAPRTRAEVALRHGILGRLGEVGRVDTHVTFWAGYADFVGVSPPRSLVALPRLRRVQEERTRHDLFTLLKGLEAPANALPDEDLVDVVRAALACSPLTDLTLLERPAPFRFAWLPPTVNIVADAALRGAVQRFVLGRGTSGLRLLEQATLDVVRAGALPAPAALTLLRFHLELLVMDALAARGGSPPSSQPVALDACLRLGPERVSQLVGMSSEALAQLFPPDPNRPTPKDPPSAPLLAGAGLLEVRS